ncbi:MAG: helix-turn-helix transcriptional regulator [Acidimicrobiales bacterium]
MRSGLLVNLDRLAEADHVVAEGRLLAKRLGDRQALALLDLARASVCFEAGDWPAADDELRSGLSAAHELGAGWLLGAHTLQALLAVHRGDSATARQALARSGQARRAGGAAPFTGGLAALATSRLHEASGQTGAAYSVLAEAWDDATARRSAAELPAVAVDLVRLSMASGDQPLARQVTDAAAALATANPKVATLKAAELLCRGLKDGDVDALLAAVEAQRAGPRPFQLAHACGEAAAALASAGRTERALALFDEASALLTQLGARHELRRIVTATRAAGLRPGRRAGHRPQRGVAALTPAERAVAELVAEGLINAEIAQKLYVSINTVRTHVSRALKKLECRTRAQLAVAIVNHQVPSR